MWNEPGEEAEESGDADIAPPLPWLNAQPRTQPFRQRTIHAVLADGRPLKNPEEDQGNGKPDSPESIPVLDETS